MSAPYRVILERLRLAFPQPISDRIHDSYLVHTFMRALDQVDALKSQLPLYGGILPADYQAHAMTAMQTQGQSVEQVTEALVRYLQGMTIYGHPRSQENVVPPPTIPSLVGVLLAALANPNLVWDAYSGRVAAAEIETSSVVARLIGYDPAISAGVFTYGGSGTLLYGLKIGLEKALPGTMASGVCGDPPVILASDASHYACYNAAGWLGLGTNAVVSVPTKPNNAIDMVKLAATARELLRSGKRIAAFIATMGTTDAFGLDDLDGILALRDDLVREFSLPYQPHVHADAVIGWAWSVFNDYDFEANPLGFRRRTIRALAITARFIRSLGKADSVGIDFHKTGFTPYVSSLILVKDRQDLRLLSRDTQVMPYLFQFGDHKPGVYTLETSRAGTGILSALANLKLFGTSGMQAIIGHLVEMAQVLREQLDGFEGVGVLNAENYGPVTLFRVYPPGNDRFGFADREIEDPGAHEEVIRNNAFNRRVYDHVRAEAMEGRGVMISWTDNYRSAACGEPLAAMKSYIMSPFVDEEHIDVVVRKVLEAAANQHAVTRTV